MDFVHYVVIADSKIEKVRANHNIVDADIGHLPVVIADSKIEKVRANHNCPSGLARQATVVIADSKIEKVRANHNKRYLNALRLQL